MAGRIPIYGRGRRMVLGRGRGRQPRRSRLRILLLLFVVWLLISAVSQNFWQDTVCYVSPGMKIVSTDRTGRSGIVISLSLRTMMAGEVPEVVVLDNFFFHEQILEGQNVPVPVGQSYVCP